MLGAFSCPFSVELGASFDYLPFKRYWDKLEGISSKHLLLSQFINWNCQSLVYNKENTIINFKRTNEIINICSMLTKG